MAQGMILLTRKKLLSHYGKSKLKKSEKCSAFDGAMRRTNRETCHRPPMNAERNSFCFNRGWMGVLPSFIVLTAIVCFIPCSTCFPSFQKTRVGPEVAQTQVIRRFSKSVENGTNHHRIHHQHSYLSERYSPREDYGRVFEEDLGRGRHVSNSSNATRLKLELNELGVGKSELEAEAQRQSKRDVKERAKRKPLFVTDDVQNYLMTFGYLPPSDRETGLLRTEDQLRSAIKTLQNFANIPVTGELDETTIKLLKKPRCGIPDFPPHSTSKRKKRYTLHGQKWHYTNLTWSLRTLQPRNLDGGQVRGVLYHALDVWAKHSKLTFQELNSDRADILVYFHSGYHGDGYAFDGRGQVLAHAFFPGKERGGDAHFDEDEVWILDPYADLEQIEGTSLFAVAAHEFGHSLGLSHSSVQGALMFPWYQGYEGLTPDLQLPDDDKHAIQQLYGPKDRLWGRINPYHPYHPERPRPETPSPTRPPTRPTRPTLPSTTPRPRTRPPTVPPKLPPPPPTRPSHPRFPQPKTPQKPSGKPDTCNTSYDAVSVIRNEVFIFKGKFLWRIGDQGLRNGYPAEITRLWYGFPEDLTHVDAVYERNDKKIVFFVGKLYYVFDANYLMPGYPKPIHYLGLPRELDHVDGAMVWGHNGKTYFFSGTMYWRFDEDVGRVELDYPRDMSMWRGVVYNIDAVFQWKDGHTYFFKNKGFWKFNDMRMRVEHERQRLSAPFWMGCPKMNEVDHWEPTRPTTKRQIADSATSLISNVHCLTTVVAAAILYSIVA